MICDTLALSLTKRRMIEYINASGAINRIEQLIDNANEHLVLVSPYLKISPNIMERLRSADARGIVIAIVYGKEQQLHREVQVDLAKLKNLKIRYYNDLHGKCYLNESGMVITSMNLYEYSQRNREMGVFVTRDEDVYKNALRDVEQLLDNSEKVRLSNRAGTMVKKVVSLIGEPHRNSRRRATGSCIRCGSKVDHDPHTPLCRSCYSTWSRFRNEDIEENHCHTCGRKEATSFKRPQCRSCYKKHLALSTGLI